MRALVLALVLAACSSDEQVTVVVVTVQARTGVVSPKELDVTVRNGSDMLTRMFMAAPVQFPATFSVTPHDRTGALVVEAQSVSPDGRTAHATGQVDIKPLARADVTVTLAPDDYVLNSRRAGAQVTSFGLGARQLGAAADGSLAFIYEDTCPQNGRCDIWSRLFDAQGTPRMNQIDRDDLDFITNSTATGTTTRPSIALLPDGTFLGAWMLLGDVTTPTDIRARVFKADATPVGLADFSLLTTLGADRDPEDPMVAALGGNRFLVTWSQERNLTPGTPEPLYVHARAVSADATFAPDFIVNTVNPPAPDLHANDDHVAPYVAVAQDGSFVVTWVRGTGGCLDTFTNAPCEVRARFFDAGGGVGPEVSVASRLSGVAITPVAVATQSGYLLVWNDKLTSGPDTDGYAIVARAFDRSGNPTWPTETVLDTTTLNVQAEPAVAAQNDGRLFVIWTDCSAKGPDADDCGIRGRALHPFGLPIGDDFQVNTTTQLKQFRPSLVALQNGAFFGAWTDQSTQPPDNDGSVRGRFLFPVFDRQDGVLGARCDASAPCGSGLVCTPRGQAGYCHQSCTNVGQPCDGGGVCMASTGSSGGNSCQYP